MVSLMEIVNFFWDQKTLIDRGEKAVKAADVQEYSYDVHSGQVQAKVHASMKNRQYIVKIKLIDGKIEAATCSCPKGQAKCHHMAAVLIYVEKNVSCTDQPCKWNIQKVSKQSKNVEDLFGAPVSVLKRKATTEDMNFFKEELKRSAPQSGISWILRDEPAINKYTKSFEAIIKEDEFIKHSNKAACLINKFAVSDEEIKQIFSKTSGQRENPTWGIYKKGRITASNFGLILRATKSQVPPSLLKTLNGEYNLDKVKAVQWGVTHEKNALALLTEIKNVSLTYGGIFLHASGLIGCSPDAVIDDETIVEVKCPSSKIDADLLKEIMTKKWYIIPKHKIITVKTLKSENNTVYEVNDVELNQKHPLGFNYYHQIQGMLHIMKKKTCILIVWTPSQSLFVHIQNEPAWFENIEKLISFYKDIYVYSLLGKL